jgi:hypothetical protein
MIHPLRALRRWLLQRDANNPSLPSAEQSALMHFTVGESFPIKGVWLKVGKVVGGDVPMLILVPSGRTRGARLRTLRALRDIGRDAMKERRRVNAALRKEAS